MNIKLENKTLNKQDKQLYLKLKNNTVIYYVKIDSISEDQMEDMMVDSIHYGYSESYT